MRLLKGVLWLAFTLIAVMWALPLVIVGSLLMATGFGAPFGAALLLVGGYPLSRQMRRVTNARHDRRN